MRFLFKIGKQEVKIYQKKGKEKKPASHAYSLTLRKNIWTINNFVHDQTMYNLIRGTYKLCFIIALVTILAKNEFWNLKIFKQNFPRQV